MKNLARFFYKDFRKRLVDGKMAQAGIGLFQMLMAIALFMAFIGAASMMYADATSKKKIQLAKQNRDLIRTNIQTIFSTVPDYSDLDDTIQGIFPDIMDKSTGFKNGWNGTVTVAPDTDPTRFTVTFSGVPEEECLVMAVDSGWITVAVNSTTIPQDGTAVSASSSACSGDNNSIVWTSN